MERFVEVLAARGVGAASSPPRRAGTRSRGGARDMLVLIGDGADVLRAARRRADPL